MRMCERCQTAMPPFVARRRVGGQRVCEGCQRTAELQNPTNGLRGQDDSEWYHGSPHEFEHFNDPATMHPLSFEDSYEDNSHWNTLLGNHFTSQHEIAARFGRGDGDGLQHIVHARLHIKRPKTYRSEHDMDQEVYEHEWKNGNHIDKHLGPEAEAYEPREWEDWAKAETFPVAHYYAGDSEHLRDKDERDVGQYRHYSSFHPYATGWLNAHPDKFEIAARFKKRLQAQGYDGIVYGNDFEQNPHDRGEKHPDFYDHPPLDLPEVSEHNRHVPQHSIAAIPFDEKQIEVTQHHYGTECKTPEELADEKSRDVLPRMNTGYSQPYLPTMDNLHHASAKTYTYTVLRYAPEGGYEEVEKTIAAPLYHGSRSRRLKPGDLITKGRKPNSWGDEGPKSTHTYFTTDLDTAASYAEQAGGHVYEVEPSGDFKTDYSGGDYKSQHPLRVVRVVPREQWARTAAKTAAMSEERKAEIMRLREERKKRRYPKPGEKRENDPLAAFFTPIPPEELEAQRRAREVVHKPERLDDRTYSLDDVSRRYDWEGFDGHEISHLVHEPERARFTLENIPVHSLRMGTDVQPVRSYREIAAQGDEERERLEGLAQGYDRGDGIPPIVVVRHGDRHIVADGSHRAAVHAERGETHIPAFVTERTIFPKTAAHGEESARWHAEQQDVYAVRSGNSMVNLCKHHAETHVGNAQAADALAEQVGLGTRERSAEMLGQARKGRCAACSKDTGYQLKLLRPPGFDRQRDKDSRQPRRQRQPYAPTNTKPLEPLKQSENALTRGYYYHGTAFDKPYDPADSRYRLSPPWRGQDPGREFHPDENTAWRHAIRQWRESDGSGFPRVFRVHSNDIGEHEETRDGGIRVRGEVRAAEEPYLHWKHPVLRHEDEPEHILYHGTAHEDEDEHLDEIRPGGSRSAFGPGTSDSSYAYATPNLSDAWTYAEKRSEMAGGVPTVYRVTPHDPEDVEVDPRGEGRGRGNLPDDKRSKSGFRVLDKVPMSKRQEHEWAHSPHNPDREDYWEEDDEDDWHHEGSLRTLADWDDEDEPDECEHCGEDKNDPETHDEVHHDWLTSQKWHTDWSEDREVGAHNNGEIQRGMALSLPRELHEIVHDEDRPLHERGRALAEHVIRSANDNGHIGRFWTDEDAVSRSYATQSQVRAGGRNDHGTPETPVVLHVKFPGYQHIETDPDELEYHGVYSYHIENNREVPLQHGTPLKAVGISWTHHKYGSSGARNWDREDAAWHRHDFDKPIKAVSSKESATLRTLADWEQGELFHAEPTGPQPSPKAEWHQRMIDKHTPAEECATCGAKHRPQDEHEECEDCYEVHHPDEGHRECGACGERHDDMEETEQHESVMTDWDQTYPGLNGTVHRVLRNMELPGHLHEIVHDEDRPLHERAQALLQHIDAEHGHALGMHWSDRHDPSGNGNDGVDKFAGSGPYDKNETQVMLHAALPERGHIEKDPDTLLEHQVYGYDQHDEYEVPIARHAPVHITGISWRPGGRNETWRRHNLDKPMEMTAVKKLPTLRMLAHDATENQDLRHCLTGDTRYLTREGVKTLAETVGTVQQVLTGPQDGVHNGWWAEAMIHEFGEQPVLRVTLRRNQQTKVLRATPEHRWIVRTKNQAQATRVVATRDLRPGYRMAHLRTPVFAGEPSWEGIRMGAVFGDGHITRHGQRTYAGITLWGGKRDLAKYFDDVATSAPTLRVLDSGVEGLRYHSGMAGYTKELPPLSEDLSYLRGWLMGYLAMDGSVGRTGQVTLSSSSLDTLLHVRDIATVLGIGTYEPTGRLRRGYGTEPTPVYVMGLSAADLSPAFFLRDDQRAAWRPPAHERYGWTVVSVEDRGEAETVYCPRVPDTESFVLEGGIHTANCPFCGGGKIIGRADGSVECEFCHNFFTVQVQPQYPNFPQTINGAPQQIPGMPGQVETPGMDGGGAAFGEDGQDDGEGDPFAGGDEEEAEPADEAAPPFAKQSLRTTAGHVLDEDDYVRHLAIRYAPDRDAMIERIRAERGAS